MVNHNKEGKNIQWGKDSLFHKWSWEHWTDTCRRMKLDPISHCAQKLTLGGLKSRNDGRPEAIKFLEENTGTKLLDTGLSNNCLIRTPTVQETRSKRNKCPSLNSTPETDNTLYVN